MTRRGRGRRPGAVGFTLIEVLVVLAVIGVTLAMVRIGGGAVDRLSGGASTDELRRFSLALADAGERAQVRGQILRVELSAGAYRFFAMDSAGRWSLLEADPTLGERALPEGWQWAAVTRQGEPVERPYRLLFGSEPVRFDITVVAGGARYVVIGTSSGAVSVEAARGGAT